MFGSNGSKVKISQEVLEKVKAAAEALGCSVEEFAEKVLLNEAEKILSELGGGEVSEEELKRVANQLKGLGYIE